MNMTLTMGPSPFPIGFRGNLVGAYYSPYRYQIAYAVFGYASEIVALAIHSHRAACTGCIGHRIVMLTERILSAKRSFLATRGMGKILIKSRDPI
jgi:hypothetical protein